MTATGESNSKMPVPFRRPDKPRTSAPSRSAQPNLDGRAGAPREPSRHDQSFVNTDVPSLRLASTGADRLRKSVLTVIAISLAIVASETLTSRSSAQPHDDVQKVAICDEGIVGHCLDMHTLELFL